MEKSKILIGTSGYSYKHWGNSVFYPDGLAQNKLLEYYCSHFSTLELNFTFYRLPSERAVEGWYKTTPKNFYFAVKGSRYITHIKRLKNSSDSIQLFASRLKLLRNKLSVVLWQLAPKSKINIESLIAFIKEIKKYLPVRHAFEFRNPSWFCDDIYNILNSNDMPICTTDWPGLKLSYPNFGSFSYTRKHGACGYLYGGSYSDSELYMELDRIRSLKKDSYIYFNNDSNGYAVKNAGKLKEFFSNT